jgi:hypothetical protein
MQTLLQLKATEVKYKTILLTQSAFLVIVSIKNWGDFGPVNQDHKTLEN